MTEPQAIELWPCGYTARCSCGSGSTSIADANLKRFIMPQVEMASNLAETTEGREKWRIKFLRIEQTEK
jgi:hypothetical protein